MHEPERKRVLRRGPDTVDPVVQSVAPQASIPAPLTGFEGLNNQDNFDQYGGYVVPPDTVGDVGRNHYVQAVNLLFRVYDKSGNALTVPLPISTLFSTLGGPCSNHDDGDPVVLYDPLADRWLISQLAFQNLSPPHQCVALSRTADPAGSWFLYDFTMPNTKLNDYPKFGVWPDAYYMSDNQFDPNFQGAGVFAFNRGKMLAGDPSASYIYFDLELLDPTIGGLLPSDVDGLTPPPVGAPNVFAYFTATEFSDPQDGLRLFNFHADFGNPGASTFSERSESPVAVASFDPTMNESSDSGPADCVQGIRWDDADDIPQPDNSGVALCRRLDSLSDRLMFRLVYRNFGSHESLVTTHSVDVNFSAITSSNGHHGGIRYYELRRALPAGSFGVNEQASFAPDADHRWMGSAAIDASGDIAVGYSVSGALTYPSIRYAGRLAGDPPNQLAQGETTLQAGSNLNETTLSRWGDYSMLAVDPVDECTFWYTTEYTAPLAGCTGSSPRCWRTRIGSFRFPSCTTPARGTVQGTVMDSGNSAPIAAARVVLVDGAGASFETTTNASGSYSRLLPPGSYTAIASATGYAPSGSTPVSVSNG
ncbi:MAG TPA: carboxypeptidase-like regulatory domain-containing protein, partial [Thermoanaerobaculia bacterium]|nr:carboxypeptidase-like regulatory domain-containing protein [Thermoanaerobaculia bacterium]